ncbi:MAG: AAA family ATPase [Patescibacteria group bacterium]|nr:AAA family ATPase [Patescibacteria group bacterium]
MYLEKLVVQGFKSFANKNELIFPGALKEGKHGLTAVVGPNGSGKSNVADAVRWALGEQSMKTLRGKKSEDVIFAGSDKKGQLGMAEVSLYLNNHDGQSSIEYSDIVLTRRLFRDGNSEYLLNNNRVRLLDVQMLLAKANFGQKTYSVIGQGMVEGFLNTSLAERKEFFDEATGVKQYQIKRDDALNKLKSSLENLSQSQMLVMEIEPRLKTLSKQMSRLEKKGQLVSELDDLSLNYYAKSWQDINTKIKDIKLKMGDLEAAANHKKEEVANLEKQLSLINIEETVNDEFDKYQAQLAEAQREKISLEKYLESLKGWLELSTEAVEKNDLLLLNNEQEKLLADLDVAKANQNKIFAEPDRRASISEIANEVEKLERDRSGLLREINRLDAWIEMKLEAAGQFDLAFLHNRHKELNELVEFSEKEISDLVANTAKEEVFLANKSAEKEGLLSRIKELNDEIRQSASLGDKAIVTEVNSRLEKSLLKLEQAEQADDLQLIRAALAEIREELKQVLVFSTGRENTIKLEKLRENLADYQLKKEKIANELSTCQLNLNVISEKKRLINAKIDSVRRELNDIDGKIKKGEEKFDAGSAKGERDELKKKESVLVEQINALRSKLSELRLADDQKRLAVTSARQQTENIERELNRVNNRLNEIKFSVTKTEIRREEFERQIILNKPDVLFEVAIINTELLNIQQRVDGAENKAIFARQKISEFNNAQETKRKKLIELQKLLQEASAENNRLLGNLNDFNLNIVRYETKLEDLELEIAENYNHLDRIKNHSVGESFNHDEAFNKIKNIKHQLELIGSIDEDAEKEYIETKERYDFLSVQVNDLNDTIKSLEEVINELDETIRGRFDKEFKVIATKFEEYFKVLFNGGDAKIVKVMSDELNDEDDDSGEAKVIESDNLTAKTLKKIKALQRVNATGLAGIEIMATPPGKKIRSIQMLSGGERALTAIALICAIISANPSPFVVLDEVDAALDEANSERLAKILDELSHKTQFIVITHNRAPMRKASILYGVTMQADGVSKLLSVKLEEIAQNK